MNDYEHNFNNSEENWSDEQSGSVPPPDHGQEPDLSPEEALPPSLGRRLFDWFKVIVIALALGLFLTTFVIQRNTVIGDSMYPTLKNKEELMIEKVSKWFGGLSRGDIITVHMDDPAFREDQSNLIKRIIGLPGEHVRIDAGRVYINGEALAEDYLPEGTKTPIKSMRFAEVTLAEDQYFIMGDNRPSSLDSRSFGPVHKSDVLGEVLIRIFPFSAIGVP